MSQLAFHRTRQRSVRFKILHPRKNARFSKSRRSAFLNYPQQFTLENRREPLALPQFQQSKHLTHALGTLCLTTEPPAIEKLALLVHKLCRTQILCGKHWKKRLQD
jgi:hypothetical protein